MMQDFVLAILETQSSYRQIIQRKMREHNIDITFEMLQILRCLGKNDGINQQDLANDSFKDKSSLSYLLKNLEKRNLVFREEDLNDKRNKLVLLTIKGKEINSQINTVINDVYRKIEEETNIEHLQVCIDYMKEFNDMVKEN